MTFAARLYHKNELIWRKYIFHFPTTIHYTKYRELKSAGTKMNLSSYLCYKLLFMVSKKPKNLKSVQKAFFYYNFFHVLIIVTKVT